MQNSTPPTDTAGTFERDVSWLFQPEDVLAHLFFAAAEIGQIQVEVQERTIGAVLAFPHEHSQSIDVLFAKAVDEDVEPGPVRICYHHAGSRFEFFDRVLTGVMLLGRPTRGARRRRRAGTSCPLFCYVLIALDGG